MKKPLITAVVVVAALSVSAACGGGGGGGKNGSVTINLDYQAAPSASDPWHHMATTWQSLLDKASKGRIKIKLFPGGQLSGGNQQKEIELVQNGTIDAAILPSAIMSTLDPRFFVVGLPWMVPNQQAADKVMDGPLGKSTFDWVSAKGMHPLAAASNGFRQLGSKKGPVSSPADVKGLKLRVPGTKALVDTWKDLGAQPETIDFAELYTALQQGTVDGEELPLPYKVSTKFYEVEKYVTVMNYSFDLIYLTLSPNAWSKLSADDRKLVVSTAQQAAQDERDFIKNAEKSSVTELQDQGVKLTELTPDQIAAFQQKVAGVYDEFSSQIGADVLNTWRQQAASAGQ